MWRAAEGDGHSGVCHRSQPGFQQGTINAGLQMLHTVIEALDYKQERQALTRPQNVSITNPLRHRNTVDTHPIQLNTPQLLLVHIPGQPEGHL